MHYEGITPTTVKLEPGLKVGTDWQFFLYGDGTGLHQSVPERVNGILGSWETAPSRGVVNIDLSTYGDDKLWWFRRPSMAPTTEMAPTSTPTS